VSVHPNVFNYVHSFSSTFFSFLSILRHSRCVDSLFVCPPPMIWCCVSTVQPYNVPLMQNSWTLSLSFGLLRVCWNRDIPRAGCQILEHRLIQMYSTPCCPCHSCGDTEMFWTSFPLFHGCRLIKNGLLSDCSISGLACFTALRRYCGSKIL